MKWTGKEGKGLQAEKNSEEGKGKFSKIYLKWTGKERDQTQFRQKGREAIVYGDQNPGLGRREGRARTA